MKIPISFFSQIVKKRVKKNRSTEVAFFWKLKDTAYGNFNDNCCLQKKCTLLQETEDSNGYNGTPSYMDPTAFATPKVCMYYRL